mgnify:CR=1 FL=1
MIESFQKFLASQPHAMSASSGNGMFSSGIASSKWIIDSGASHHMSHRLPDFVSLSPNSSMSIMTANGDSMPLAGVGSILLLHNMCLCLMFTIYPILP